MSHLKFCITALLALNLSSSQVLAGIEVIDHQDESSLKAATKLNPRSIHTEDLILFLKDPDENHFIQLSTGESAKLRRHFDKENVLASFEHGPRILSIQEFVMHELSQRSHTKEGFESLRSLSVEAKAQILGNLHHLGDPRKGADLALKLAAPKNLIPQISTALALITENPSATKANAAPALYRALFEAWILADGLKKAQDHFESLSDRVKPRPIFSQVIKESLAAGILTGERNLVSSSQPQDEIKTPSDSVKSFIKRDIPHYRKLKALTAPMRNDIHSEKLSLAQFILAADESLPHPQNDGEQVPLSHWLLPLFPKGGISNVSTLLISDETPTQNPELWRLYVDYLPYAATKQATLDELRAALAVPLASNLQARLAFAKLVLPAYRESEVEKLARTLTPEVEGILREMILREPEGKLRRFEKAVFRHCMTRKILGF